MTSVGSETSIPTTKRRRPRGHRDRQISILIAAYYLRWLLSNQTRAVQFSSSAGPRIIFPLDPVAKKFLILSIVYNTYSEMTNYHHICSYKLMTVT
jgi:hypothetical protein